MIKKWVFIYFSWEFYFHSTVKYIYIFLRLIREFFPWDKVWTLAIRLEHKKNNFLVLLVWELRSGNFSIFFFFVGLKSYVGKKIGPLFADNIQIFLLNLRKL